MTSVIINDELSDINNAKKKKKRVKRKIINLKWTDSPEDIVRPITETNTMTSY